MVIRKLVVDNKKKKKKKKADGLPVEQYERNQLRKLLIVSQTIIIIIIERVNPNVFQQNEATIANRFD